MLLLYRNHYCMCRVCSMKLCLGLNLTNAVHSLDVIEIYWDLHYWHMCYCQMVRDEIQTLIDAIVSKSYEYCLVQTDQIEYNALCCQWFPNLIN